MRLRQENCLNPGGGGCGEPRLRHCTPAWVTRAKLRLKKKKKKKKKSKCMHLFHITDYLKDPEREEDRKGQIMGKDPMVKRYREIHREKRKSSSGKGRM